MHGGIEMRKMTLAFLISIMSMPAMADNWIKFKAQAVEDAINTLVSPGNRQDAADEYQKQMDPTTGKISVMGIYKVCAAAGNDIRTNDGYTQCRYFINTIAEKSEFGSGSAIQANCTSKFNGIWSLSADGKEYQCVGKDGHKLVYKKMCDIGTEGCIKQFAGLKTQGPVGREFIAEYAKIKNLNLTCKIGFEQRRSLKSPFGQDYIQCSAGGKSYEFEFNSLNQTPDNTSVEGENKAMCELFGGKIVKTPDRSVAKYWNSCEIAIDICNGKLQALAIRIGHSTMYQGYCRLSREVNSKTAVFLNQIKGVDSYKFYKSGAQMRADMAKVQLEEYLRNTFPNESYIICNPTVKPLSGNGMGVDYVLSCTVGTQQVDFVFDDLTETSTKRAATGMDAMQCIISGGTFKGETCRGPTPAECTKLNAALRAKGSTEGAKWDENARTCILGNAMKTYKADVVTGYVVGAVVIVGGALLVIGSDGLATPIVVESAEMLLTDLAINWTIDWNHKRLSKQAANRFGSFMDDAEKCNSEQCALDILKKHYATLSGVMGDLNKDDQAVVDATMDRLIGLIQTEYVACGKNADGQIVYANPADCAKQNSTLRAIDYIDKASQPVLIIGSIIYNPGYVSRRFVQMKQINKVAQGMNVSYKEAKAMVRAGDVVVDANGVVRSAAYETKLRNAYKKYAPKDQSYDDFTKMFASEADFDKQIALWADFEPGYVKKHFYKEYVPGPYSTYDPELAKKLTDIDAAYADDIAKLDADIAPIRQAVRPYKDQKRMELTEEIREVEKIASERLGREVKNKDWDLPELEDLAKQRKDLYDRIYNPRESDYSPETFALIVEQEKLDNFRDGYIMARDYEKNKLIDATVSDDVADAVVAARRQELINIIADDDKLFEQAQRFPDLSIEDKEAFLTTVHSRLDDVTHSPDPFVKTAQVFEDPESSIVANAMRQYNNKPSGKELDTNQILETIIHEQGHNIDSVSPNLNMLGAQKASIDTAGPTIGRIEDTKLAWNTMEPVVDKFKGIESDAYYKSRPTEYSSYKIGGGDNFDDANLMQQINERRALQQ